MYSKYPLFSADIELSVGSYVYTSYWLCKSVTGWLSTLTMTDKLFLGTLLY